MMTEKSNESTVDTDSRKSRYDWIRSTTDSSRRYTGVSLGNGQEVKRHVMLAILGLVTLAAVLIGLALIWLVPEPPAPTPYTSPNSVPLERDFLLANSFAVERNTTLLAPDDNERFYTVRKNTLCRYSVSGDRQKVWTFPRENTSETEPTAVCYVDFPEKDNPFYKCLLLACGNEIYYVDPTGDQLKVNRLPIPLERDSRILSIAWDGERIFLADFAKSRVYSCNRKDWNKKTIIADSRDPDGFPGFHLSKVPCFGLAYCRKTNILYASNSAMFRVEAFDPETGDWLKDQSWGEGPWKPEGFSGCCNPVGMAVLSSGQIVTTEKGKMPQVRVFEQNGTLVSQINNPNETIPLDGKSWLRMAVLDDSRFVLLSPQGKIYIYERILKSGNVSQNIPEEASAVEHTVDKQVEQKSPPESTPSKVKEEN